VIEVVHATAVELLRAVMARPGHDITRTVVFTDPPWPGCEHVPIEGSDDALGVWGPAAAIVPDVADRLILHLGHNSDPRGMLGAVPVSMRFATTVTLRMVPPGYRGCFMGGDLAYVFGKMRLPQGTRVLPGEIVSNGPEHARERGRLEHPCPRSPQHVRGLLTAYCARADLVVDPFCGSGTVIAEAAKLGINAIGGDSDLRWVLESRGRDARAQGQTVMDFERRPEQLTMER
jgi:hypothetical protein